jgi:uncharacterized repeat protein (TIGR01451 family)
MNSLSRKSNRQRGALILSVFLILLGMLGQTLLVASADLSTQEAPEVEPEPAAEPEVEAVPEPEPVPEPAPEPVVEPEPAPEPVVEAEPEVQLRALPEADASRDVEEVEVEEPSVSALQIANDPHPGVPVYGAPNGDPTGMKCRYVNFRYTDGHTDHFVVCGELATNDLTPGMRGAPFPGWLHVQKLHISCSDGFTGNPKKYGPGWAGGFDKGDPLPADPNHGMQPESYRHPQYPFDHFVQSWRQVHYSNYATANQKIDKDCGRVEIPQDPQVAITKHIDGDKKDHTILAGGTAVWTIRVSNTGDVPLTNVQVNDALAPACARTGGNALGTIPVGEHREYTCESTNVQEGFTNVAQVTTSETGPKEDSAIVRVRRPAISITKNHTEGPPVVKPQTVAYNGTATWTITVRNTGDVPLTGVQVRDPLAPNCNRTIGNLAVGSVVSYQCSLSGVTADFVNRAIVSSNETPDAHDDAPVTVTPLAPVLSSQLSCTELSVDTNVALVSVRLNFADGSFQEITSGESGQLTFRGTGTHAGKVISSAVITSSVSSLTRTVNQENDCEPRIAVVKSGNFWTAAYGPDGLNRPAGFGQTITYSYVVTNTGPIALRDVAAVDDVLGQLTLTNASGQPVTTLAPNASAFATAFHPVTAADQAAGMIENEVTATGDSDYGPPTPAIDDWQVPVTPADPSIQVIKGANRVHATLGQTILYDYTVRNDGNVPLTEVTLVDDVLGDLTDLLATRTLAPGEQTRVLDVPHVVTQADVDRGFVTNVVVTTGQPPTGPPVEDEDTVTVTVPTGPAIRVVKQADRGLAELGDEITYTYTVTNIGSIVLNDVTLVDDVLGDLTDRLGTRTLQPGQSTTATATHTVTQADVNRGFVYNVAITTGTPPTGPPVQDEDDERVTTPPTVPPALSGEFTCEALSVSTNEALTSVVLTFAAESGGGTQTFPNPGSQRLFTGTGDNAGKVIQYADVSSTSLNQRFVNVIADCFPANPAIEVVKSADRSEAALGDVVTYTYVIRNTGDVVLDDITIVDDVIGGLTDQLATRTLAPGESTTVTATYTITAADVERGFVTNVVIVTGRDPDGGVVEDDDEVTVPTEEEDVLGDPVILAAFSCDTLSVQSDRELQAVTLTFTDGVSQRFTDLTGTSGQFSGTGAQRGKIIASAQVEVAGAARTFTSAIDPADCVDAPPPPRPEEPDTTVVIGTPPLRPTTTLISQAPPAPPAQRLARTGAEGSQALLLALLALGLGAVLVRAGRQPATGSPTRRPVTRRPGSGIWGSE